MSQQLVSEEFDKSRRVGNVTDSGTMAFRRNRGHQLKVKTNTTVVSLLKTRVNVPISMTASTQVLGPPGIKQWIVLFGLLVDFFTSRGLNIHFPIEKQRRADKRYFEDQYGEFVLQFGMLCGWLCVLCEQEQ